MFGGPLLLVPQIRSLKISRKKLKDGWLELEKKLMKTKYSLERNLSIVGAIVEYAELENIDLLVIGSRGLTGFKKLLVGSVASGVVTYAHCPVTVVK
jgi:nucleotide-binding universal stress UspA family protein